MRTLIHTLAEVDLENSDRVAGTLASYIDTCYFSEHSIKIIQNFKEKVATAAPLATPNSALG